MNNVTCRVDDGIAQVRLNRPDKLNAIDLELLDELLAISRGLRRDKELRAVVLAGEGDTFCSGLDFAATMSRPAEVARRFVPMPWRGTNVFQEAPWSLRRIPVPVIAAVQGHCLGGGLQIALAADFRIATPDSNWSVLEGKWGLVPDMSGAHALRQLVGIDRAKKLTMTAEMFSGEQAHDLGLATELDADPIAAATTLAERLAAKSPDALAAGKRLFDTTWHAGPRRTFARERREQLTLLVAENTKILRNATMQKVPPVFKPRRR